MSNYFCIVVLTLDTNYLDGIQKVHYTTIANIELVPVRDLSQLCSQYLCPGHLSGKTVN